ncbi:MAG: 6-phosphogluconolactonase [Bryobacteraceae bacterium]
MSGDAIRISDDAESAASACASFVLETLRGALKNKASATFAMSGGSTPRLLFSRLAASGFDWSNVHFFWVDERCVPPDDSQSNYKLANETLIGPAKIKSSNVHRVLGELEPEVAAKRYVDEIVRFFGSDGLPEFDLIHRGMGPDAHTASLFPGDPLIDNRTDIAAAVWVEKMKSHRVTLLPGVLLKAPQTVLQVAGADKAEALHNVLRGPEDVRQYPCQLGTRGSDRAVWFLDKAAAAKR